jgi:hypothetical protein
MRWRLILTTTMVVACAGLTSAPSASATSPGAYTGWSLNAASGCSTRAQAPYMNSSLQVYAHPQVYCPSQTVLTVYMRIQSARTLAKDATVGTTGCTGSTARTVAVGPGTVTYTVACARTSQRGTHGYHSDILIYPGVQSFSGTGSESAGLRYSSACAG